MANSFFRFKQFTVHQDRCAMKVTTDGCLFGAWASATATPGFNTMLDIGTGTGLLSLMMAQHHAGNITALDIDPDACDQAKENVARSPWPNQVSVTCADIRQHAFPGPFDLVISNPPFYENELKSADIKKNVAHHGHQLTLHQLFTLTRDFLREKGEFLILVPHKRWEETRELASRHGLCIKEAVFVRQSVKHGPFRVMIRGCVIADEQSVMKVDEISIWDDAQQYTPAFRALLSPYYLAL